MRGDQLLDWYRRELAKSDRKRCRHSETMMKVYRLSLVFNLGFVVACIVKGVL